MQGRYSSRLHRVALGYADITWPHHPVGVLLLIQTERNGTMTLAQLSSELCAILRVILTNQSKHRLRSAGDIYPTLPLVLKASVLQLQAPTTRSAPLNTSHNGGFKVQDSHDITRADLQLFPRRAERLYAHHIFPAWLLQLVLRLA